MLSFLGCLGGPFLTKVILPDRHLFPHVTVDELHHRRLQGRIQTRAGSLVASLRFFRLLLSPDGGRGHRAAAHKLLPANSRGTNEKITRQELATDSRFPAWLLQRKSGTCRLPGSVR